MTNLQAPRAMAHHSCQSRERCCPPAAAWAMNSTPHKDPRHYSNWIEIRPFRIHPEWCSRILSQNLWDQWNSLPSKSPGELWNKGHRAALPRLSTLWKPADLVRRRIQMPRGEAFCRNQEALRERNSDGSLRDQQSCPFYRHREDSFCECR